MFKQMLFQMLRTLRTIFLKKEKSVK